MVKLVEIKQHPTCPDWIVVVFQTKVKHELALPASIPKSEIFYEITRYLKGYDVEGPEGKMHVKGYEDEYPLTAD